MAWNISVGQLGLAAWLCSLLHVSCSFAEYRRLEKVLDFLATTENIHVFNVFLVLNPKHSSYWEVN